MGLKQSLVEVLVLLVCVDCSNVTLKWNMNNLTRQRPIISDQVAEAAASDNLVAPFAWLACSWTPNHPRPFCLIGFVSEKKHFARLPSSLCRCFYTHPFWSSYRYFKFQTRENVLEAASRSWCIFHILFFLRFRPFSHVSTSQSKGPKGPRSWETF